MSRLQRGIAFGYDFVRLCVDMVEGDQVRADGLAPVVDEDRAVAVAVEGDAQVAAAFALACGGERDLDAFGAAIALRTPGASCGPR